MPANSKEYEFDLTIGGKIDPSLPSALGVSVREVQKMQRAMKDIAQVTGKINLAQNGIFSPRAMVDAQKKMSGLHATLGQIATIASGTGVGFLLAQGFDMAISKAQAFSGFIGDAVKKAADFQTNSLQLQIETGDDPKQLKELMDRLQFSANKSPFHLPALSEGVRHLMAMGFSNQDDAMKFMHSEMNIAAATKKPGESFDVHFTQINDAFAKAIAQGHIMERNLYMLENAGIKVRPFLEQKMGLAPGTLGDLQSDESLDAVRKAVKGGKLNASMLMDFARQITSSGGKYSDEAVAPIIRNFAGATSTFGDMVEQFERGIGKPIMDGITMLTNRINDAFTWDRFKAVQSFFENVSAASDKFFSPIIKQMVDDPAWQKTMADFSSLLSSMGNDFQKLQPTFLELAHSVPLVADDMVKFASAIERIMNGVGKFLGWADNAEKAFDRNTAPIDGMAYAKDYDRFGYHMPHFAEGGIVSGATVALLGERGTEAVLPLDSFNDLVAQERELTSAIQTLTDGVRYGGYGSGGFNLGSGYNGGLMETAYGYPGDSTPDWNSAHGIGDHNNRLTPYFSAALSPSTARRLGVKKGQVFWYNGRQLRYDDTCPTDGRVDVYSPNHRPDHHVHITMNIQALDHHGFDRVLKENSDALGHHVRRALQDSFVAQAVV